LRLSVKVSGNQGLQTICRPLQTEKFMNRLASDCVGNSGAQAPQSKRWRDCWTWHDLAKRLECGRFTAAFGTTAKNAKIKGIAPKSRRYAPKFL